MARFEIMVLTLICLLAAGCGSKAPGPSTGDVQPPCGNMSEVGHWVATSPASDLVLNANCTGTESSCSSVFTFDQITGGQLPITATASTCLALGLNLCSSSVTNNGQTYTLNCGTGNVVYTRQ